jgi:hypothetical protein
MNKTLLGLAVLPFVAGTAMAAQPLTNQQMDTVTAGHVLSETDVTDVSFVIVNIGEPAVPASAIPTSLEVLGNVVLPLTTIQVLWGAIP